MSVVKQAIHALKQDPERTVRNLVDMALKFADSRFQQQFYSEAQTLLSDERSAYYTLAKDTLAKVNEETLLTFSMNLGYHGLYEGAETIRTTEENSGFNIPWTISLTIVEGKLYDQHHRLIMQGEQMGIHCWHLFSDHGIYECITLAESHPESAFIIFCGIGEINRNVIDYAGGLHNIAFAVPFDKQADTVCQLLSTGGILYAVYDTYSADDLADIEDGVRFEEMQLLNPVFTILKPNYLCGYCDHVFGCSRNFHLCKSDWRCVGLLSEHGTDHIFWSKYPRSKIPGILDCPHAEYSLDRTIRAELLSVSADLYINTRYLIVDDSMTSALCLAAKSGVDVRIITPHKWDKWMVHMTTRSYYRELIKAGVKIYEYTNGFNHSKTFVSDDAIATVGTTNLDFRSLYHHFECGTVVYGGRAVSQVKEDFLQTLQICQPVSEADCHNNLLIRILQDVLRLFAPLM